MMVHMGLSLLTVALEAGADHISKFNSLLYLIKDDMCKNLFFVSANSFYKRRYLTIAGHDFSSEHLVILLLE